MKSNLRNEIKSYIVRQGMTMQEVVDLLHDEHGWSDSVSNLSNKLQRESLRYVEAVQLADALGYEIVWQRRQRKRRICCKHSTAWRKRRHGTGSRNARSVPVGSFRRVQSWRKCCRRCGRWSCLRWRIT